MPRSASAGASSRSATCFNAPRGSPAASARAAAVISESIRIPPHLSLPPLHCPALNIAHGNQMPGRIENETRGDRTMSRGVIGTREQWLKARIELLKAEKEFTRRSDELALQRQELPWVPVNKGY